MYILCPIQSKCLKMIISTIAITFFTKSQFYLPKGSTQFKLLLLFSNGKVSLFDMALDKK